jgi:hypothetical protein
MSALMKIGVVQTLAGPGKTFVGGLRGSTWEFWTVQELNQLYGRIMILLNNSKNDRFALGDAARMILGDDGATRLQALEGIALRPV